MTQDHVAHMAASHCRTHKIDRLHSSLTRVCRELAGLQSAYQTERLEGDKVRQLLAYEETRRCNLEESLDQAHKHAKDQLRDLQNKVPISIERNTRHLVCTVHAA